MNTTGCSLYFSKVTVSYELYYFKIIRIGLPVHEFLLLNLAISDHVIKSHIKRMHFVVKSYTYFSMCIFLNDVQILFSRSLFCKFYGGGPQVDYFAETSSQD